MSSASLDCFMYIVRYLVWYPNYHFYQQCEFASVIFSSEISILQNELTRLLTIANSVLKEPIKKGDAHST